jgi:lipopolysaccharide/colanic/teichoic acid biosynthesis glycosyltransferase
MEGSTTRLWSVQPAGWIERRDSELYYRCKRFMDVCITSLGLLLLLPLLLLIAVVIKLDSPGPVFFRQERVGSRRRTRDGEPIWEIQNFRIWKFRTMYKDVDDSLHREYIRAFVGGTLEASANANSKFKLANDPRITRAGQFLRRTSIDELPQLFNVLRGEMSLVGPRPVPEYEVAEYREAWQHERLAALPGVTGLWQVMGRGEVPFEEMVRLDLDYIRCQSLWLDIKILVLTIPAVLTGRGAE